MRVFVAGRDESGGLGEEIARRAAALEAGPAPRFLSPQHSALSLRDAGNERAFGDLYLELLGIRHGVDFRAGPPRGPGARGRLAAVLKSAVWRLVAGRVERIVTRQNTINELMVQGLDNQNRRLRAEVEDLRRRLGAAGGGPAARGAGDAP
jgi:hypothetical protein